MRRPRVLTVAGSDPSGGAGLQADLATFAVHGCHGMAVPSALTVQNSVGVSEVLPVRPAALGRQLAALFCDGPPAAAKTGLLGTAGAVQVVADVIRSEPGVPWVVDPVAVSGGGMPLTPGVALEALWRDLVPLAALVTPNRPEAESAAGGPVRGTDDAVGAARRLVDRGAAAVLVKGGHGDEDEVADVLVLRGETEPYVFRRPRVRLPRRVHGTGCALSAAIAAGLARGLPLRQAVRVAGDWVHAGLREAYECGEGALSLDRLVPVPEGGR